MPAPTPDSRCRRPPGASVAATVGERVRATVRELIPGVADADAAAIEAERTKLAGDLHAVVLPSLRRAIADVEAGGPVEALADRLRAVDLELERLMADRWPVILDAFGLVEAIEDLAERTEHEAGIEIGLEVASATGRPPLEIERTGWRIVQLALDNAVRHAAATTVTVAIAVSPERLRLSIADDGEGIDAAELTPRSGPGHEGWPTFGAGHGTWARPSTWRRGRGGHRRHLRLAGRDLSPGHEKPGRRGLCDRAEFSAVESGGG